MTDAEISEEFDRLWTLQKRSPRGPDADQIVHIIAAKSNKTLSQVREILRDKTFQPPV